MHGATAGTSEEALQAGSGDGSHLLLQWSRGSAELMLSPLRGGHPPDAKIGKNKRTQEVSSFSIPSAFQFPSSASY